PAAAAAAGPTDGLPDGADDEQFGIFGFGVALPEVLPLTVLRRLRWRDAGPTPRIRRSMKQQDRNERDSFAGAPEDGPHSTRWGTKGVASIQIGDVVGGHYVVEGVLDEGGMAVVYEARNQATGKAVALKVL